MKKKNQNLSQVKIKNFVKKNSLLLGFIVFIIVVGLIMVVANDTTSDEDRVFGDDVIEVHFFHLSTCPHCHAQIAFHPTMRDQYPNMKIIEYKITEPGAREAYADFAARFDNVDAARISTPTTFIGNRSNVGYGSDLTSGQILLDMLAEEQARIDANWDENTMIRTLDLRAQLEAQ